MISRCASWLLVVAFGIAACSSSDPRSDSTSEVDADSAVSDRGSDVFSGADADSRDTKGNGDVADPPLPRCSFVEPLDGAVIEDTQTRVVLQTDNIAAGSVAAILVNFEPTKTAVVDKAGVAEFPTVPLPAASSDLVELRGDIRVSFNHHITCKIHVTVK